MKFQIDWDSGFRSGFLQFDAPNVHSAVQIIWAVANQELGDIRITTKATRWTLNKKDKDVLRKDIIDIFNYEEVSRHTVWNIDGTMAHLETATGE